MLQLNVGVFEWLFKEFEVVELGVYVSFENDSYMIYCRFKNF